MGLMALHTLEPEPLKLAIAQLGAPLLVAPAARVVWVGHSHAPQDAFVAKAAWDHEELRPGTVPQCCPARHHLPVRVVVQ